jgi:hypothetical protein
MPDSVAHDHRTAGRDSEIDPPEVERWARIAVTEGQ